MGKLTKAEDKTFNLASGRNVVAAFGCNNLNPWLDAGDIVLLERVMLVKSVLTKM